MILKEILFIIAIAIFTFLGLSTILADTVIVGKYGSIFGQQNRFYMGYISFVYPFILIVSAFFIYKKPNFSKRRAEIILSSMLLFFALLIFQAASVSNELKGYVGYSIVEFFGEYIGTIGVWIFIIATILLSVVILFNISFEDLIKRFPKININKKISSFQNSPFKKKEIKLNNDEFIDVGFHHAKPKQIEQEDIKLEIPSVQEYEADKHSKLDEVINTFLKDNRENEVVSEDNHVTIPDAKEKIAEHELFKEEIKKSNVITEVEENKKLLDQIEKGEVKKPKNFKLPYLDFLKSPASSKHEIDEHEIDIKQQNLLDKLAKFKIEGDVPKIYSGPVVTTFEFRPKPHIKVSKILTLQDDLAMALKAQTIRIQAPVPGKDVVGIEIPNNETEMIYLREVLDSEIFKKSTSPLTIVLGKDIVGNAFVTDLKKLPHLLIAGTTGSGKSVGIHSMLLSLLYKNSPDDLKLLMIDPKMLEFSIYNDIPHLLTPVITQSKQAIIALSNMVLEMERRYKIMSKVKVKNIENYNEKAKREGLEPFPYIVVIIDELADLMMTSGKDVEFYIARLAQMARASGIHLIVATQRPSVDVVTGLIKANLPSRISFKVGQKIDSKVILDSLGAESLLGRGDMLFTPPGMSGLIRLHAPYVSEDEIESVVEFLKTQRPVEYDDSFLIEPGSNGEGGSSERNTMDEDFDELYEEAKNIVLSEKKTSISYIQRRLQIGYNRAARIVEQLEMTGVLSAANHKGQREIL